MFQDHLFSLNRERKIRWNGELFWESKFIGSIGVCSFKGIKPFSRSPLVVSLLDPKGHHALLQIACQKSSHNIKKRTRVKRICHPSFRF